MKRRVIAIWLLCLLPVLAACGARPETPNAPALKIGLTWTGTELTGLRFYQRKTERAVIHYALPTMPDFAEQLVGQVDAFWKKVLKEERAPRQRQVHIWVVPPGYAWPTGNLPQKRSAWAAAPGVMVVSDPIKPDRLDQYLFPALFEGPGSPTFAVEWLQDGYGMVMASQLNKFPSAPFRAPAAGALDQINGKGEWYPDASMALAGLLMDRFGFDWTYHYPKPAADLTPELAVQWATGSADTTEAVERWEQRMAYVRKAGNNQLLISSHAAAISPLRMEPALPALPPGPGAAANFSRSDYDLTLKLEPDQGRLAGTERLTWQNGESIPVDTLYFNLWANSEQMTMYGGQTLVESVTVAGAAVPHEVRALDLKVPLGRPVAPGESVTVTIRFTTRLTGSTTHPLGHTGTDSFYLGRFYPVLAVLDDRGWNLHAGFGDPYAEPASYRVTLEVPAGMPVSGTGRQTGRQEEGDRWIYTFAADGVPEWAAVGGTKLKEVRGSAGNVAVTVLHWDENWSAKVLEGAREAIAYLESQLGPMPSPGVTIVHSPEIELPGVLGLVELDSSGMWKNLLTHRLAHEWFGYSVGSDQWGEAWLDEGLARFMEREAARAMGREKSVTYAPDPRLERLKSEIGPAAMSRLLRDWVATYRGTTATGDDFVRMAESIAGRPLGELWQSVKIDPAARKPYKPLMPLGATQPRP